jgi:hypothetical protein
LFYNNAYLLEKLKNEDESLYIYQKGMQFSTSILGDLNMLSNRFRPKMIAKLPKNKLYESKLIDDISLIDVNSLGESTLNKNIFQKIVKNNYNKVKLIFIYV